MVRSIGIIGARGHVGSELIRMIAAHPQFDLAFVSSRERAGQMLSAHEPDYGGDLSYVSYGPEEAAEQGADALVLALPNDKSAPFVVAVDTQAANTCIVDLSADYRFDDGWYYGLPELTRNRYAGEKRISNPGCYATAMQLLVAPMLDVLAGPVQCFGVSGYSGAGTTPSDKNDLDKLRDNLIPYALANHIHERETARQLDREIQFMPHVAPHFRGLTVTANLPLSRVFERDEVVARFHERYGGEPLVRVLDDAPWVSRIASHHHVEVGGFTLSPDGRRLVAVATLDNLLKGAATQALQNLNIAFGYDEMAGIPAVEQSA